MFARLFICLPVCLTVWHGRALWSYGAFNAHLSLLLTANTKYFTYLLVTCCWWTSQESAFQLSISAMTRVKVRVTCYLLLMDFVMAQRPRELGDFKGVGHCEVILGWRVTFRANIYGLQLCRWNFHKKKLCSRLYSIEIEFCSNKKSLFEPPFGDLGVTYALHL